MVPQIYFNTYKQAPADLTYEIPTREDLELSHPRYYTDKEVEEIKQMTREQVLQLIDNYTK